MFIYLLIHIFLFLATGSNAKNAKNKKIAVFFNGHVDRIDSSDIVKGEPVGNGSFGEVCKGSYKGTPIVIKSVNFIS